MIALIEDHARASAARAREVYERALRYEERIAECPCTRGEVCSRYLSDDGRTCRTYVCAGCRLRLPWCYGAADSPLCDGCAAGEASGEEGRT